MVSNISHTGTSRAERLMAMGEMAAALAHEIRNPLGSMELYCSLLKKDLNSQPEALELAEHIHIGIKRLERIIANCLQFAREVIPRSQSVLIEEFLGAVVCDLLPHTQQSGVRVTISAPKGERIETDTHLLHQAVLNLALNAVEATREKAATNMTEEHVRLVATCSEAGWAVSVIDQGTGILESDQGKVFDPFFTTKSEGNGLGLAIVHSIVGALGGTLELVSTQGVGTTVTISLPRKESTQQEKEKGDERETAAHIAC